MKQRIATAAAAFIAAAVLLGAAQTARFVPAKTSSTVTIHGTSTLHEWEMKGSTIAGSIETDPEAWTTDGAKSALVKVSMPVASIRSEHDRMDRIMRDALKSESNPDISYAMTSASLLKTAGDSFVVRAAGRLTVAGTTRDVSMDVTVERIAPGRYALAGQLPIRMTDYGIKPPVTMMGTLKTGDAVTVSFRWIVERS